MQGRQKYFDYKSLDDLRRDVARLGLGLTFEEKLDAVWRSVRIGNRVAGNSLAVHPMEGCDGMLDGAPDELTFRRWKRFGAGGAKLIWGEATAVVEDGRANPRQLFIHDRNVSVFSRLVYETRQSHRDSCDDDGDLLVGVQLTHSGRWSCATPVIAYHHPLMDARTRFKGAPIDPDYPIVTDDYLERLEDSFVHAARLCVQAGFDFIDLKQCHSYLTHELLGARTREGKYGGDFNNRTRFIRNTILKISEAVGGKIMLASRINAFDGVPFVPDPATGVGKPEQFPLPYLHDFGVNQNDPHTPDLAEPHGLISLMQEIGVVLINVTLGSPYCNPHIGRPYEKPHDGGYLPPEHPLIGVDRHIGITSEITRRHPGMVVVGTGYSWLQEYFLAAAEARIRNGDVAMVGIGRGALAYPEFAMKAKEHGKLASRNLCMTDSMCTTLMRAKGNELGQFPTGCVPRDKFYAQEFKKLTEKKARS